MAPLDPQQLLKALDELLGPKGAIKGPTEAVRVANLMKDASKLVSKCVYINILKVDTPSETLEKLLSVGGWDTINDWLQECKDEENYPLLVEILKVYQVLPITVEILKTNKAAKTIKQLCKSDNESAKTLATNIFAEWMKKVKGNNNNEDNSKKKKKREKESEKKDSEKSSQKSDNSSSNSDHNKSKIRDSKHSLHSHQNESSHAEREKKSDERKTKKTREIEEENMDSSSNDSAQSDEKVTIRQGSGLKLHIKLGSDKDKERTESKTEEKKRPSTVKRPPSKFRSTGLEESVPLAKLPKNADLSKPIPKRTGCDIKSELPIKRSRPNMPPPLIVPPPATSSTPTATSPQSPEIHGKIKIIPARPKSSRVLHESSGFMDSLETSHRNYGVVKKKRRSSGSIGSAPTKGSGVPTTPPSPVSPTTATARSLPSVPSFYKDTQEAEASPEKEEKTDIKKERSPSPTVLEECNTNGDIKTEIKTEPEADHENEKENTRERSESPADSNSSTKESKGLLTTGATKMKKKKKSVSWKEESELKEVFYFELDDDERVNVNRPKDFSQAQRNEMMADRRAFESSIRMKNDHMSEQVMWYRPKIVDGYKVFEYGKESKEKSIQKQREQRVLQALFFNKNMLPDNPHEPDMDHEEPEDSKTIPLEDMSGGEEFLYNYDSHPQAVKNKSTSGGPSTAITAPNKSQAGAPVNNSNIEPPFPAPQISQPPPVMPPGFNVPPGMQLPPDLINILNHLQNQPSNPNDPVMSQVQQILNNIMCGGGEQAFEQLQQIQQILNSPMGPPPDGMMQGPPPGMPMIGMPPPGGPPPMGPRTLLGNAPPGFMPPMPMGPGQGPGPNRFGPPGPPGNWGPQGNMGGPPQMGGPPRGNFRGRMRGPGPIRNFRGGQSGSFKVLCRHFAGGKCRMGNRCTFLHPGINGPYMSEEQMNQMLEQQMMDQSMPPAGLESGSHFGPQSGNS